MPEEEIEKIESEYVQRLKVAREVGVVLKARLASLRSTDSEGLVFAFEGIDDKAVYYAWIRRIDADLIYEPFPCDGKGQLLKLKDQLDRDRSGLAKGVYFFIDRDFDDLRDSAPSENLFMTEAYSFENYLVDGGVLEEVLKNEMHCHAEIECRVAVGALFERLYRAFLEITRDINFRIYLARKCKIYQNSELPQRINRLAAVTLTGVQAVDDDITALVVLEREPSAEEIAAHEGAFDELLPPLRYRGKFALLFFRKLLEQLAADRNSSESVHFAKLSREGLRARGHLELDALAGKSQLPAGLQAFIAKVRHAAEAMAPQPMAPAATS